MYQSITIVGRLGQDPELRYTANGTPVANMSVAVDGFKHGEKTTTWFRVAVWGGSAEAAANHLHKGSVVLVAGTVEASAWKKDNDICMASLEVNAYTVRFLPSARRDGSQSSA